MWGESSERNKAVRFIFMFYNFSICHTSILDSYQMNACEWFRYVSDLSSPPTQNDRHKCHPKPDLIAKSAGRQVNFVLTPVCLFESKKRTPYAIRDMHRFEWVHQTSWFHFHINFYKSKVEHHLCRRILQIIFIYVLYPFFPYRCRLAGFHCSKPNIVLQ